MRFQRHISRPRALAYRWESAKNFAQHLSWKTLINDQARAF